MHSPPLTSPIFAIQLSRWLYSFSSYSYKSSSKSFVHSDTSGNKDNLENVENLQLTWIYPYVNHLIFFLNWHNWIEKKYLIENLKLLFRLRAIKVWKLVEVLHFKIEFVSKFNVTNEIGQSSQFVRVLINHENVFAIKMLWVNRLLCI